MNEANENRYFIGLDLAPAGEFTALAVLERPLVRERLIGSEMPPYAVRHLKRLPPGSAYPEILDSVRSLLRTPPLPGSMLVLDQTGVGQAVMSLFADGLRGRVRCRFCPITINVGNDANIQRSGLHVPKKELVGMLQVLLQTRRLQVARELPDADVLVKELESFRLKAPTAGTDTLETWRSGQHDDMVLAVALGGVGGREIVASHYGTEAITKPSGLGIGERDVKEELRVRIGHRTGAGLHRARHRGDEPEAYK